jgi:hypothetical protein
VKRPGRRARKPVAGDTAVPGNQEAATAHSVITVSDLSLHELFQQQARTLLERADIGEEQKQSILLALGCPCCATTGISFSMKLKKES